MVDDDDDDFAGVLVGGVGGLLLVLIPILPFGDGIEDNLGDPLGDVLTR